jgi:hypothetical protein
MDGVFIIKFFIEISKNKKPQRAVNIYIINTSYKEMPCFIIPYCFFLESHPVDLLLI